MIRLFIALLCLTTATINLSQGNPNVFYVQSLWILLTFGCVGVSYSITELLSQPK